MARNPKFTGLLREMQTMHDRKNEDYATAGNPYSNFEFSGQLGAMFTRPVDISFAVLCGVKIARLAELRGKGKQPKNESVQDTFLDLAVYATLWASYDRKEEAEPTMEDLGGMVLIPAREREGWRSLEKPQEEMKRPGWRGPAVSPSWGVRGEQPQSPLGEESY